MTPEESKRIWAKVAQIKKDKERLRKEQDDLWDKFKPEITTLEAEVKILIRQFHERTGLGVVDILISYPFTNKVGGSTDYFAPEVAIGVENINL